MPKRKVSEKLNIKTQNSEEHTQPPKEFDGDFSDFKELSLSDDEKNSLIKLHNLTAETGNEYGITIDNGVASDPYTDDNPFTVNVDLKNVSSNAIVFHSHNDASPQSPSDLYVLTNKKVDKIGVIGYNNDAYIISIGQGIRPSHDELKDVLEEIQKQVIKDLPLMYEDFSFWSPEERYYMLIRERNLRTARFFEWEMEGGRLE